MTSACDTCAAHCCRNYFIAIDGWDVYRIANGLKLPPVDFCHLERRDAADPDFRILLDGTVDPEERNAFYCLSIKKVPAPIVGGADERCVFLMTVGERGRCGIYDLRPGVCRVYPTSMHAGVIGASGGGRYCPPGAWNIEALDLEVFRTRWHEHRLHRWIQQELVDGWNERLVALGEARPAEQFYDYLLLFYASLEEREPALFAPRPLMQWPIDRVHAAIDGTLRAIGWRTDETVRSSDPHLGWRKPSHMLDGSDVTIVYDPDEDVDPAEAYLRARLSPESMMDARIAAAKAARAAAGDDEPDADELAGPGGRPRPSGL